MESFYLFPSELAEQLLSELIPGWEEDEEEYEGEEGDDLQMEGDDDDDDDDRPCDADATGCGGVRLPDDAQVVDASYRACILEAERYLVQCEGMAADDGVVTGLKHHLHLARQARVIEAQLAPRPPAAAHLPAPQQVRQRPPGYP